MRNTFLIAQNMFKTIFKKKSNIIVYIILPIVLVLVFMSMQGASSSSKVSMGVVNKDNTEIATGMLKYLDSTEKFKIVSINEANLEDKVMFIMVMLIGSATTSTLILKEKRERTYQRICASPVSPKQYIIGNIIVNLFIVFIQVTIVLFLATMVLRYNTHVPAMQLLIILMSFGTVAVAMGLLIVVFSNSTASASNLSTLIITPTCMLGGCFWPVSIMPQSVQRLSDFIPQSWALGAIRRLQTGAQLKDILGNIVILFIFAITFFLISVYKMKKDMNVQRFI